MKSVLTGICLMVIVSGLAWIVMGSQATTSSEAFVSSNNSVRLDN